MNPYEPTVTFTTDSKVQVNQVDCRKRNPAKRYLIACSVLCLLGAIVSLVALIVFWQAPARGPFAQTMAFVAFSVYCATSAYLAYGAFGRANRVFTIIWALAAILGIAFVITYVDPADPTDARNMPGILLLGGCFATLGYIAWLCAFANAKVLAPENTSPKA